MYDEATRKRALEFVASGMSYVDASRKMGGKPGPAIIRKWSMNELPTGKRSKRMAYTQRQKLDALGRIEAGEDYTAVAAEVGCTPSTLLTWRKLREQGGDEALVTAVDRMLSLVP